MSAAPSFGSVLDDSEALFQTAALQLLHRLGFWARPNIVVAKRRRPTGLGTGSPDVLACLRGGGRLFFIELKKPKGVVSPKQLEWHAEARAAGIVIYTARTLDEIVTIATAERKIFDGA